MKIETTRKYIEGSFTNVLTCSYAKDLQSIYTGVDPVYYNSGAYGWNYDVYVDYTTNTAITTGYRKTFGKPIDDKIIAKYSEKAKEITNKILPYSEIRVQLDENINAFIKEVLSQK